MALLWHLKPISGLPVITKANDPVWGVQHKVCGEQNGGPMASIVMPIVKYAANCEICCQHESAAAGAAARHLERGHVESLGYWCISDCM